ncbi:hypothetical protein XM38_003570 [Halomicronema hongdechloris C2206]|uniref:Uncharacterized protein n=1 Tax=Halomicronema hongdechloris C2206 TaxID=1641165 RepID=A0A1Z3HGJ0_9CYAN|nr:hypothetical protein [Halomicronema hongdechloris]ASC69430.1 hypothetical protein XM38_003570 [Halomicronema hongdechloris C2206]
MGKLAPKANPFMTYRDPNTGRWVTVVPKTTQALQWAASRPQETIEVLEPDQFWQLAHGAATCSDARQLDTSRELVTARN